jgi:hypothetical protein
VSAGILVFRLESSKVWLRELCAFDRWIALLCSQRQEKRSQRWEKRELIMNFLRTLLIVLGIGLLPTLAAASGASELCSGSINLTEGQWARFAVDAPFIVERLESRYAIVGSEGSDYWMEFEIATPMGNGNVIMKTLIPGWPYAEGKIKRALMQLPFGEGMEAMPPMEMPPSSMKKDDPANPIRMACDELENGVEESVTVTAGTFRATRISLRREGKDIWLSSEVPFGIIKFADQDNKGMELMAIGNDAESGITAEPQKIPGMDSQ